MWLTCGPQISNTYCALVGERSVPTGLFQVNLWWVGGLRLTVPSRHRYCFTTFACKRFIVYVRYLRSPVLPGYNVSHFGFTRSSRFTAATVYSVYKHGVKHKTILLHFCFKDSCRFLTCLLCLYSLSFVRFHLWWFIHFIPCSLAEKISNTHPRPSLFVIPFTESYCHFLFSRGSWSLLSVAALATDLLRCFNLVGSCALTHEFLFEWHPSIFALKR